MKSVNPATETVIGEYAAHTPAEIDRAMSAAADAFSSWRAAPYARRADLLRRVAAALTARRSELAALMTAEVGKPIGASEAEIDKCAAGCMFFADNVEKMLADVAVHTEAHASFIAFDFYDRVTDTLLRNPRINERSPRIN